MSGNLTELRGRMLSRRRKFRLRARAVNGSARLQPPLAWAAAPSFAGTKSALRISRCGYSLRIAATRAFTLWRNMAA